MPVDSVITEGGVRGLLRGRPRGVLVLDGESSVEAPEPNAAVERQIGLERVDAIRPVAIPLVPAEVGFVAVLVHP